MELTEIIAAKPAEIKAFMSQPSKTEGNTLNGKTFGEMLASMSSEENVKTVSANEKSSENVKKEEKTAPEEKLEKTSESKKDEKVKSEKISEKQENNSKEKTVDEESQFYKFLSLNFVTEENVEASEANQVDVEKAGIGKIQEKILDKMTSSSDEERIKLLTSAQKIEESEDFDFEIVSNEALALESAQGASIESPEEFLNNLQAKMDLENMELNTNPSDGESKPLSEADKLKSKFHVTDLRTEKPAETNIKDEAEPKVKVTMTGNDSATIEMNLNQESQLVNQNVLSNNTQVASSEGSNFQAMLNNQLQANASEIVKAGNIVLKDNNKGTINMILHPDDLGNIKLQLSLDGKTVTGTITVNTKEALEVFKNNSQTLKEAFIANGFENAEFDVAFNNGGQNGNQNFNQPQEQNMNHFFAKREYDSLNSISDASENVNYNEEFSEIRKVGINIVA